MTTICSWFSKPCGGRTRRIRRGITADCQIEFPPNAPGLQKRAFKLGKKIFGEKPGAFERRLEGWLCRKPPKK